VFYSIISLSCTCIFKLTFVVKILFHSSESTFYAPSTIQVGSLLLLMPRLNTAAY